MDARLPVVVMASVWLAAVAATTALVACGCWWWWWWWWWSWCSRAAPSSAAAASAASAAAFAFAAAPAAATGDWLRRYSTLIKLKCLHVPSLLAGVLSIHGGGLLMIQEKFLDEFDTICEQLIDMEEAKVGGVCVEWVSE